MTDKKVLKLDHPSPESNWCHRSEEGMDTIVFVHGILGDSLDTWGEFPNLLHSDPELPMLDILCWGYKSGWVPCQYKDIESESQGLVTDLLDQVQEDKPVYLVAHSMGGLVTLKGVTSLSEEHQDTAALLDSIKMITLYATPLKGSAVANLVSWVVHSNPLTFAMKFVLPGPHLSALRKGKFVNDLLKEVNDKLDRVDIYENAPNNKLTIQACVAKRDRLVSKRSGIGPFQSSPQWRYLEGDHSSCKLPTTYTHQAYKVLKNNLAKKINLSFRYLCTRATDGAIDTIDRKMALRQLVEQYDVLIKRCVRESYPNIDEPTERQRRGVLRNLIAIGKKGSRTPEECARRVITDFEISDDFLEEVSKP